MSASRTYVIAFSDTRRWQTTVSAASGIEAIQLAEALWTSGGVDGNHPFDLVDDCIFDQPEWRIEDEAPPERDWSISFHRTAVFHGTVKASTEREALGIAQAMVHETDVALFKREALTDGKWRATPLFDGGQS
ncbi:MAG: hypothetical protein ABL982_26360 [Vicinamibacterales bacterium]